jgi:hypothetical protein
MRRLLWLIETGRVDPASTDAAGMTPARPANRDYAATAGTGKAAASPIIFAERRAADNAQGLDYTFVIAFLCPVQTRFTFWIVQAAPMRPGARVGHGGKGALTPHPRRSAPAIEERVMC